MQNLQNFLTRIQVPDHCLHILLKDMHTACTLRGVQLQFVEEKSHTTEKTFTNEMSIYQQKKEMHISLDQKICRCACLLTPSLHSLVSDRNRRSEAERWAAHTCIQHSF